LRRHRRSPKTRQPIPTHVATGPRSALTTEHEADQIVLGHLMVDEKSNEIPAAPELIEALGLKGCVFTLDAEHAQKNRSSA